MNRFVRNMTDMMDSNLRQQHRQDGLKLEREKADSKFNSHRDDCAACTGHDVVGISSGKGCANGMHLAEKLLQCGRALKGDK